MKIVMVIPKLILAGAETMCENLSLELVKMGHEVTVIALFNNECAVSQRMRDGGVKVITLGKKVGFDKSMYTKLETIFNDEKPDVIHTHLYVTKYAIPAAKDLDVRKVHTMHNLAKMENLTIGGNFLNRIFFKHKNVIPVALSEKIQASVVKKYHLKKENVPIVYNGIPLSRCIPKTDYGFGDTVEILNVGRLTEQKNQANLLEAMKLVHENHKNIHLTILGEGELYDSLTNQIKRDKQESYISIIPPVDNVYPLLNKADILALPSTYEGMPMTIIEAMGTGLPILASEVGGIPDMIKDEYSGFLCGTLPSEIAEGLNKLIESEELRKYLGTNAIKESENFSSHRMAENYLNVYKQGQ